MKVPHSIPSVLLAALPGLLGAAAVILFAVAALRAGVAIASDPAGNEAGGQATGKQYVCAPCGMPCDEKVYDHPGACPVCGAALVARAATASAPSPSPARKRVAILIFEGVQIIDYTGPYEVFGQGGFDVYTVAESNAMITTAMGMKVTPEHTFADAPAPDVLVVPGGDVNSALRSPSTMAWVKRESGLAGRTMSVCNGAFILASAGLLDGLGATTYFPMIPDLRAQFPEVKVVSDQRYVDNGRIITTAGLSSGIDGALHVVAEIQGLGRAQRVALNMEYGWNPESGFVRGRMADRVIPRLDLDDVGRWTIARTEGTTDRWTIEVKGSSDLGASDLMDRVGRRLVEEAHWTGTSSKAAVDAPASVPRNRFTFSDHDGGRWNGALSVRPGASQPREFTLTIEVSKAG